MEVYIRRAKVYEFRILTDISFDAKRYWEYPEEYFEIWRDELTITPEYINDNIVFVGERDGAIAGYVSLTEVKEDFQSGKTTVEKGYWLEHIFIQPRYISQGVGRQLFVYAVNWCARQGIDSFRLFSDPHANGFYDRMGARYIKEVPSSIADRTVSLYEMQVKQ